MFACSSPLQLSEWTSPHSNDLASSHRAFLRRGLGRHRQLRRGSRLPPAPRPPRSGRTLAPPNPTRHTDRLARQRLGQARHPPRLPPRHARRHERLQPPAAPSSFVDKAHLPRPPLQRRAEASASSPAAAPSAPAPTSPRASSSMPPAYVNVGAYVDEGTMVDSHALVGSCAQIGKRVHLSAAAQIGGVLEPVNASPVIIEDDVPHRRQHRRLRRHHRPQPRRARRRHHPHPRHPRLRPRQRTHPQAPAPKPRSSSPPAPSSSPAPAPSPHGPGKELGLTVYTPIIVKYRDEKTDLSTTLEDLLR